MHRSDFRSSALQGSGSQRRRLGTLVRFSFALLAATLLAILASSTRTTPPDADTAADSAALRSCKPLPPLDIQLQAVGSSAWSATLGNTGPQRDVVVWMWSESAAPGAAQERRIVWSGMLHADELRTQLLAYAPPADAVRVWASLEAAEQSSAPEAPVVRGMAVAAGPAAAAGAAQKTSVLLVEPSGRQVEQYVGKGGLQ